MGVLVLNTGWEGREQADSPQHGPYLCSVHGQIHLSAALVLVLSRHGSQQFPCGRQVHRLIPSSRW